MASTAGSVLHAGDSGKEVVLRVGDTVSVVVPVSGADDWAASTIELPPFLLRGAPMHPPPGEVAVEKGDVVANQRQFTIRGVKAGPVTVVIERGKGQYEQQAEKSFTLGVTVL
eukprot:TRINITY_DN7701_c0_g1_i1.p2 TRINITY_DN7701_c0_g1~~TRINITY_DN7701_c0_g1_i1.p2  ORF type:complete len:113 (+),score=32.48 TRINITY_DN7701_c0_g1_i1:9-347(+)